MTSSVGPQTPVSLGVIVGVHGIKGAVRIKTFTGSGRDIASYGPLFDKEGRSYRLKVLSVKDPVATVMVEGIADRTEAEKLRGTELFVDRSVFPTLAEEEFYQTDLIGLKAEDEEGALLGVVVAVLNFGAQDLLSIQDDQGRRHEVPFLKEAVLIVDLTEGKIVIAAPYATFVQGTPLELP